METWAFGKCLDHVEQRAEEPGVAVFEGDSDQLRDLIEDRDPDQSLDETPC